MDIYRLDHLYNSKKSNQPLREVSEELVEVASSAESDLFPRHAATISGEKKTTVSYVLPLNGFSYSPNFGARTSIATGHQESKPVRHHRLNGFDIIFVRSY